MKCEFSFHNSNIEIKTSVFQRGTLWLLQLLCLDILNTSHKLMSITRCWRCLACSCTDLVLCLSVQRGVEINDSFSADGEEHLWKLPLQTVLCMTSTPFDLHKHTHRQTKKKNQYLSLVNMIIKVKQHETLRRSRPVL